MHLINFIIIIILMEKLYSKLKQSVEIFNLGHVSYQLKELLTLISEGKEIKKEKFSQISPEALSFLQEKAKFLEENELKYIFLALLTEPKPENQTYIIEIFKKFIDENREKTTEKISQEKLEAEKFIYFYRALEETRKEGWFDALLSFYSNPENQKIRPEILEEALKEARKEGWWNALLSFYSNPENQKIRPEILEEALKEARKEGSLRGLLSFYSNPENQKIRPEILEEALKEARKEGSWSGLLSFYSNPENQKIRPYLLEEALEKARKRGLWIDLVFLLSFYSHPENQKVRPDIFEEALEKARKGGWFDALLSFYSHPENQKVRPDIFEEALEKARKEGWFVALLSFYSHPENQKVRPDIFEEALKKAKKEGWWVGFLSFYSNPENQPKLTQTIQNKIIKSIKTITDENLHADVLEIYSKYFKSKDNPLSLFLLSKNEDLPILISAYDLNIQPEVILSWNLTRKEKETILPILMDFNKHNIKFPFPFIFYPLKEVKQTRKHNELMIDYLRTLDFIVNLPQEAKSNLIGNHFKNIEVLVQKYNITQTTIDISFSFLREIIDNIKDLKQEAFQKLKQILQIQEKINQKEWERFIKESKYLNQLITLTTHYSQIYKEGLPLLGKIATAMVKGTYFNLRYNLENPITQEQLAPLLEKITKKQKKQKILDIWRGNYFSFHLQSVEEIKQETKRTIDYASILEHLRSQIIGHRHYESILNLISGLNEEDNKNLSSIFKEALTGKTINFEEIRKILEKYQLSRKQINCLIGIIQLLKDLNSKKKPEEYLSTLERLEKNIQNNWAELLKTEIVQIDIFTYLKDQLNQLKSPSEIITKTKILVSYFTDHPKTLLEIGAYPVSTCQDYRSKGKLNSMLLGYIFDAHIKALVAREIEIEENFKIEDLKQAQIEIDDNNETITIILKNGKKIKSPISKPIARRIVMLGKLNNQPVLLLEPIYTKIGRTDEEIKYLNKPIEKLLEELSNEGINIETTNFKNTITPLSHNPVGYYRDI